MIEAKKGNLSLYVAPTKLVGDCAVGLCFDMKINSCAMCRLTSGGNSCGTECFPEGSEEACLCYSLFMMVEQALCGSPDAVAKSKVGRVVCNLHNGMFFINWNTKGNASAVRKSIGIALKVLNPAKTNPIYSRLVKEMNGNPKKESFNYVADMAMKSIKSGLQIGVVGNIKVDKDKVNDMLDVLVNKVNLSPVEGKKEAPKDHNNCVHDNFVEVKVAGWESAVVSEFLKSRVKGLNVYLCDKYILLPIKEAQWETLQKKLKDSVADYAESKYGKLKDKLPEVWGYVSLSSGMVCCTDVKSAIKNMNVSGVKAAINKAIK